jgi:hypothetical protein
MEGKYGLPCAGSLGSRKTGYNILDR